MPRQSKRERWLAAMSRTQSLPPTTRLFLSFTLVAHMRADGFVSYPRHQLAKEAGINPRRVSQHLQAAVDLGWLTRYAPGYHGHTAEFYAQIPDPKGAKTLHPSETAEGCKESAPFEFETLHPFHAQKGARSLHPNKKNPPAAGCTGDAETCPCRHCFDWRIAVGVVITHDPNDLGIGRDAKSKKNRNHLRAVGE